MAWLPTRRTTRGWLADALRLAAVVPSIEFARGRFSPRRLLHRLRELARSAPIRSDLDRSRLRRLVRIVDRLLPGGPNCYRRVLMEVALDRAAATSAVCIGMNIDGASAHGHAWLSDARAPPVEDHYQVRFEL